MSPISFTIVFQSFRQLISDAVQEELQDRIDVRLKAQKTLLLFHILRLVETANSVSYSKSRLHLCCFRFLRHEILQSEVAQSLRQSLLRIVDNEGILSDASRYFGATDTSC